MEKFKSLLTSKKFWTLVAAIVAALTAFFTTSCVASAKVQRHGVHIDTVRVDYIIRSRNIQTASVCPTNLSTPIRPLSTPTFFPSIPVFETSIASATIISSLPVIFNGSLIPQKNAMPLDYSRFSNLCSSTKSIMSTTLIPSCSVMAPLCLSNPPCRTFGEKCLIAFVPIAFVRRSRRRGGRKGRPRPSTKTVSLGGSHL